jgi:hypothetical protein
MPLDWKLVDHLKLLYICSGAKLEGFDIVTSMQISLSLRIYNVVIIKTINVLTSCTNKHLQNVC